MHLYNSNGDDDSQDSCLELPVTYGDANSKDIDAVACSCLRWSLTHVDALATAGR